MSIGSYPDEDSSDDYQWDVPSPTDSESSNTTASDTTPSPNKPLQHQYPSSQSLPTSPTKSRTPLPSKPSSHPYTYTTTSNQRPIRPRQTGLTPLSTNSALPLGQGALPKAQPLSRALFARMASDTSIGGGTKKKTGGQKLIVPTKGFKRTFELDLSASELARKS